MSYIIIFISDIEKILLSKHKAKLPLVTSGTVYNFVVTFKGNGLHPHYNTYSDETIGFVY